MSTRRASILIETIIAVTMLGIAVPVGVSWMQTAAADRADAVSSLRASAMATSIAEHIIADSVSSAAGLGMDAMENAAAYLDTPSTGLRARLATLLAPYSAARFTYEVQIGPLVGPQGSATGNEELDVVRRVTIVVRAPGARGGTLDLSLSLMITDPA
ncbi:MAG: hypothetical protein AMXMBFR58_34770 [Phycisphaerae bacterium]